jgi:hypothetical protein
MKSNLLIIAAIALSWVSVATATDIPAGVINNTLSSNLVTCVHATAVTNPTSTAFWVELANYHTIVSTVATNGLTNAVVVVVSGSLDNTNWVTLGTNSIAATGGTAYAGLTGKFKYIKAAVTSQKGTVSVDYLGGK